MERTDIQKLEDLFSEIGLTPNIDRGAKGSTIEIIAKETPKCEGYIGFSALFLFTPEGEFVEVTLGEH